MALANDQFLGSNAPGGSATTVTLTTAATVASGGFIVLKVHWYGAPTLSSVSGGGLTWTIDKQAKNSGDANISVAIVSAQAAAGLASGTVITATYSATTAGRGISGRSFTGVATSSVVDGTPTSDTTGTSVWSCGGLVTANADDLIIGAATGDGADTTSTPGAGYTEDADFNTGGGGDSFTSVYRIVSATGTYTATGTWASAQTGNIGAAVAYKAAAGGGTDASVTALPAVSASDSPIPAVAAGVSVTAAVALSAGDAPAPSVSAGIAPVNTVAPAITNDSAHGGDSELAFDGETLTCGTGTWTGDATITYAFEWKTNSGNLVVSGTDTYVVDPGDFPFGAASDILVCTVTATNGVGSDAAGASTTPSYAGAPSADATVTALPAVAAGRSPAPTVSIGTNATVTAVPALSSGDSPAQTVTAGATVTAVPALSLGSAPAVNGLVSIVVTAPACVALGSSPVPTVGGAGDVSVTAVPAVSSGDSPAPTFQAGVTVTAAVAVPAGSSPAPAVGFGATVTAIPALSAGQAPRPAVSPAPPGGGGTALVTATFAEDAA